MEGKTNEDFRRLLQQPKTKSGGQHKDKSNAGKKEQNANKKNSEKDSKYRDRARERRELKNNEYREIEKEVEEVLKARGVQVNDKLGVLQLITVDESKIFGGSLDRTHLVKGLDRALLSQYRAKLEARLGRKQIQEQEKANRLEKEIQQLKIKNPMALSIYKTLLQRDAYASSSSAVADMFQPGRMAYKLSLAHKKQSKKKEGKRKGAEEQASESEGESSDDEDDKYYLPTTILRSKEELPDLPPRVLAKVDAGVLAQLSAILSHIRSHYKSNSKKGFNFRKEQDALVAALVNRGRGDAAAATHAVAQPVALPPQVGATNTAAVEDDDVDIFDDVDAQGAPGGGPQSGTGKFGKSGRSYFGSGVRDGDARRDGTDDDGARGNGLFDKNAIKADLAEQGAYGDTGARVKAGGSTGADRGLADLTNAEPYRGMGSRVARQQPKMVMTKDGDMKISEGGDGEYDVAGGMGGDSEEEDLDQMDQKGGGPHRHDFTTDEQWQQHKSTKQAMPKAAFQFGIKQTDGRVNSRNLGAGGGGMARKQQEKEVRQLQKIQKVFDKKGFKHSEAFTRPGKDKRGGGGDGGDGGEGAGQGRKRIRIG